MKIKDVYCATEGRTAPRDHWNIPRGKEGACTRPPMPPGLIRQIIAGAVNDTRHADGNVTSTRMLTCPREVIILDNFPITFDPRRLHSAFIGTQVDRLIKEGSLPGEYSEVVIPPTKFFEGTKYEVEVSGAIDYLSPDAVFIDDYKFHGDRSYWYKMKSGGLSPELRAQLTFYKWGVEKNVPGAKVTKGGVWHGAMTAASVDDDAGRPETPWFYADVPFFESEEEVLRIRPSDADKKPGTQPYTVGDIILFYKAHKERVAGGMSVMESAKMVPLVGRNMFNKTKCIKYCVAQKQCDEMEGLSWGM